MWRPIFSVSMLITIVIGLAGCGAGEFGQQTGVLPRSSLPIIGGGETFLGLKTIYLKTGERLWGNVFHDTRTNTYRVPNANVYKEGEFPGRKVDDMRIPADQVLYIGGAFDHVK